MFKIIFFKQSDGSVLAIGPEQTLNQITIKSISIAGHGLEDQELLQNFRLRNLSNMSAMFIYAYAQHLTDSRDIYRSGTVEM